MSDQNNRRESRKKTTGNTAGHAAADTAGRAGRRKSGQLSPRLKKLQRIAAMAGVVLLLGLYLVTFILGVFGNADTQKLFMACVVLTVLVPVLLYAMFLTARILSGRGMKEGIEQAEREVGAEKNAADEEDTEGN